MNAILQLVTDNKLAILGLIALGTVAAVQKDATLAGAAVGALAAFVQQAKKDPAVG